jgi:hypothetical protein
LPAEKGIIIRRKVVMLNAVTPLELLSSGIRKGGIGRGGGRGKRGYKKGQLEELEERASSLYPSSLLFCPEDRDSKFL